ncbi:Zinc finger MYM-type protein 1-like [Oopsacas minuta]|uniref:Zinc finger MYM-type protein 1-like n=1 Tax=Oopsacas minuta TaxID=111878 RepID=A0AAV7K578_9METZ|nr:Zinc finger MYM-type protein 1-like [Oopsacas minuta]
MSGEFKGVQSEIRRECPTAPYVHCSSHCLNPSLSKASTVQAVRNTVGTISEVITFINASAKRLHCFIEKAKDAPDAGAKKRLIRICETRWWVERHESVSRFRNFFEEISMWCDTTASSSKAWTFKASILKHEFVIALLTMENVLSVTKPVSEKLQTVDKGYYTMLIRNTFVCRWSKE